ncbi:hypothetical protein K437DRAFT_158120 [Tilletiaria anomala UBC 951]|uniref:Uncharacterized protein n=1 Tax=Tilletiaria anomala (strain ATCC 24038 / CBS 436.72 / UBC 951) TaxID=1037660 RepID=A0A066VR48_TILAU|nr:uncharacterized protein K437DRAFT_158120 [Tilletiaria anomala UBC 951]KDN42743.1 hypothetical protein K437DRAFT_158120 [Tilletiaria anomala UBC 951]
MPAMDPSPFTEPHTSPSCNAQPEKYQQSKEENSSSMPVADQLAPVISPITEDNADYDDKKQQEQYEQQEQQKGFDNVFDLDQQRAALTRPPRLLYDFHARRRSFALNIFLIVFFNLCCPILIFYILLQYDDTHKHDDNNNILYGATTATLGTLQLPQFAYRWWVLYKRNGARDPVLLYEPECDGEREPVQGSADTLKKKRTPFRPPGIFACWDIFQAGFFGGIVVGTSALVSACSLFGDHGYFPLLALSPPIIFGYIGLAMLATGIAHATRCTMPCAMFDRPRGERVRPGLGYIWPDLVALDGGGGVEFRNSFSRRYDASLPFRRMVATLNWIIAVGLTLQLAPEIALATLVHDRMIVYGTSWAILTSIMLLQLAASLIYAKRSFRNEHEWWVTRQQ